MNHKISLCAVTEIQKSPLSKQTPNCSDGCGTDWGDSSTHGHSPQTGVHKVTAASVFSLVDQWVFTGAIHRRMGERSFTKSRESSEVATSPENPSRHRRPLEISLSAVWLVRVSSLSNRLILFIMLGWTLKKLPGSNFLLVPGLQFAFCLYLGLLG